MCNMKNLKKKVSQLSVAVLSASMLIQPFTINSLAASAAITNTVKTNQSQDINVTAEVDSEWKVEIPKAVNLKSDEKGSGTYNRGYCYK